MQRWITDTATTDRFPLYTRGNADEVGPVPFPPLTWTLTWEQGAAPGTADGWVALGGFRPEEFRQPVPEVFGCWGGYFYNQVSVGRVFGERMPGGSAQALDQAYFGSNADIPPYVPDPRDEDPELSARLGETLAWVLSTDRIEFLDEFVEQVRAWARARPDLSALSDVELVTYGREANRRLRRTWDVYAQIVIGASVGPGVVAGVAAAVGRPDAALSVFTSLGDVPTATTSREVWRLSRLVHGSPVLSDAFEAGVPGLLERLAADDSPAAQEFGSSFAELLAEHGHRGPNEWDLASDSWLTNPSLALSMIDQVRRQQDDAGPDARSGPGRELRERTTAELLELTAGDPATQGLLQSAIRSGQLFYRLRETGKDAAVRVMLEAKLPFFELGRRLHARGALAAPEHVFQVLEPELDELVADGGLRDVLAERAVQFATLAERVPPYIVQHGSEIPPISHWPLRSAAADGAVAVAGEQLQGVGVSPGTVTGRVQVVGDLSEAEGLAPGDVLVCATTDPSWVPLFMVAGAVVCEIGAQASHAAIVSRELGVPCAVSVPQATSRLRTGSTVTVDGGTGTVTVTDAG